MNDSDCEVLTNSPVSKTCSGSGHTVVNKIVESDMTVSDNDCITQQVINMQILS